MTYAEKLKDPRWQKKRLEIFERENYTCQSCGDTSTTLHVHHCHYFKGNPWDTDSGWLKLLCEKCHELRQALEDSCTLNLHGLFNTYFTDLDRLKDFCEQFRYVYAKCLTEYAEPRLEDANESEYQSNCRWFNYAWDHPDGREMYEKVTGLKVNWPK